MTAKPRSGESIRAVVWAKEEPFGVEDAEVRLSGSGMRARGVAIGTDRIPYRLDYRLTAARSFVTARMLVEAHGEGWARRLDLRRDSVGTWSAEWRQTGSDPLAPPDTQLDQLSPDARDCDLGLSPLTNTMPVLQHRLLARPEPVTLTAAWISVPDLSVRATSQRYELVRRQAGGAVVRFSGADGFTADIEVDDEGLVTDYPGLARRLPTARPTL